MNLIQFQCFAFSEQKIGITDPTKNLSEFIKMQHEISFIPKFTKIVLCSLNF